MLRRYINGLLETLDVKLIVLGPSDIIWIYFMIATVIAVAGTIPVLATQIWLFVKPALKPIEKKVTLSYIPALFVLISCRTCIWLFCHFSDSHEFRCRAWRRYGRNKLYC